MNRLIAFIFYGLILLCNQVNGQSYYQQFKNLISKNDTIGQQQLLEMWEKTDRNDPELYVAYFNYFVKKSKREIVRLDGNGNGKDGFQVLDKDIAKKEPVAFIYGDTYYDKDILKKGFDYIDSGIKRNPDRLDMRFGKIYMFGQIEAYEAFTAEIIKTIEYSALNKNQWTWADSKPVDDPKRFFLGSLQDYQVQLYNTENDELLVNMKRIAESILKYYPDHIESLSNLSIVYMLQKQYDKAIEPLLKAEKLDPKDFIVLGNIAQAYKLKGDKENAIRYFELTLKHGDDRAKKYAQEQMEELRKK